jgi:hypothetical protein
MKLLFRVHIIGIQDKEKSITFPGQTTPMRALAQVQEVDHRPMILILTLLRSQTLARVMDLLADAEGAMPASGVGFVLKCWR